MKTQPLYRFVFCAVLATGSARSIGINEPSDADAVMAGEEPASINATSMSLSPTPDCELLKHNVDEDPRWNFETAGLASCECRSHWGLLKCKVVIPNDHIFDEKNIGNDPEKCGRSVYNAVPRGWSGKSGPRCNLDRENTAHLTWKNGIGTNMKYIKKGLDGGTCGQFKDVQCNRIKD